MGRWVKNELTSSLDEEEEDKEEKRDDEALVGAFHSEGYDKYDHFRVNTMGPGFYLKENQREFHHWFRQYPESIFDHLPLSTPTL